MGLLDSHTHLWEEDIAQAEWLEGEQNRALRRSFRIDELADVAGPGVTFVCVAAESTTGETLRLLELAKVHPPIAAVVGWIDPFDPQFIDGLAGVRLPLVSWGPQRLADPRLMAGIREIGARGLVIDLLVNAEHLPAVASMVNALPDVTFVLDHVGAPGTSAWRADAIELAKLPNIVTKLSGPALNADVGAVLEAFGPDRVLFGSDWPVSTLQRTYAATFTCVRAIVSELCWDLSGVFGLNAARVYGITA